MKKPIITILTTLILTVTGSSFAQDIDTGPEKKKHRQQSNMQVMPVVDQVMRAIRQLDLNDEQKAGIREIMRTMKEDVRPVVKEIKAGHFQLKELIEADTFDENAIAAVAEKEGNLTTERVMIASRAVSQALKLLTDEQRDELKAVVAKRQERRGERHQQQPSES